MVPGADPCPCYAPFVTRRPSSAPTLVLLLILGLLLAACGGSTESGSPSVPPSATPSTSTSDLPSSDPGASVAPSTEPEPTASDEPSETPSDEPTAEPSGDPSASPGAASACTGTAKNQEFYVSVAEAVAWTVYCPVLPAGWNVVSGQYRLAGGGKMEIGFKGPAGARLALGEGGFCGDDNGCVPPGTELGDAAFGDRTGTLVAADDGSWAVVVDQGANPSWLLTGTGLDDAAFRAIAADLVAVDG